MPSKPPPAPPKGTRHPGSGRAKGTPNRISVEVRTLVSELVTNADYQHQLREDFSRRKVHPTIEALIWTYHLGKPKQQIELDARIDVNQKLEEERRLFASLDVAALEDLAADSQRLIDKAHALSARSRAQLPAGTPHLVVEGETLEDPTKTLGKEAGSDNRDYVPSPEPATGDSTTPTESEG